MARSTSRSRTVDWFPDLAVEVPGLVFCARSVCREALGAEAWAGLEPHTHSWWELSWLRSGSLDWWAGDAVDEIGPHDCYLTPPGLPQGSVSGLLEPSELWWIHLIPEQVAGLDAQQLADLLALLHARPRQFSGGDLLPYWCDLLTAVDRPPGRPWSTPERIEAQACLHRLLMAVLTDRAVHRRPPALERALACGADGQGSIAELARAADCSLSALNRLFRDGLGDTPAAWLRRQRLSRAKRRLCTCEDDVTTIAIDLGFPSSQHFATSFRQATGLTPSAFRQKAQQAVRSAQTTDEKSSGVVKRA